MKVSIKSMRAAGLSDEKIVRALEIEESERMATEREYARQRQRRYRKELSSKNKDRVTDVTRDKRHTGELFNEINDRVTVSRVTASPSPPLFPPSMVSPITPSLTTPLISPSHISRSIPENWTLSEEDSAYARSKGWANDRVVSEAERFKLHFLDNGKAHKNWHLTWCKWVTSPYQSNGAGNGKAQAGKRSGSLLDAIDRFQERIANGADSEACLDAVFGLSQGRILGS